VHRTFSLSRSYRQRDPPLRCPTDERCPASPTVTRELEQSLDERSDQTPYPEKQDKTFRAYRQYGELVVIAPAAMASALPTSTAANFANPQPTPVPAAPSSPPAAAKSKDLKSWWSRFNVNKKSPPANGITPISLASHLEDMLVKTLPAFVGGSNLCQRYRQRYSEDEELFVQGMIALEVSPEATSDLGNSRMTSLVTLPALAVSVQVQSQPEIVPKKFSIGRVCQSGKGFLFCVFSSKVGNDVDQEIVVPPPAGIFGVPLRQSIAYANVAISLVDPEGKSYIYGYVPIVVAKCGVFLKEKGTWDFSWILGPVANSCRTATNVEGIFRLAGSNRRIRELQTIFDSPDRYGKGLDCKFFLSQSSCLCIIVLIVFRGGIYRS
jgi:hypothetical protein